MSDFPKWLLALAGINLLPLVACPFYIFAAPTFGTTPGTLANLLSFIGVQLLWIVPLCLFFAGLDRYRRGYERLGVALIVLGLLFVFGGAALFLL